METTAKTELRLRVMVLSLHSFSRLTFPAPPETFSLFELLTLVVDFY